MKCSTLTIALVSGGLFLATSVFATPLVEMQKQNYPYGGRGVEEYGKTAEKKAIKANEKLLMETLTGQIKNAEDNARKGIVNKGDPFHPTHPGYPYRN